MQQLGTNVLLNVHRPVSYTHLDVYKRQLLHYVVEVHECILALELEREIAYALQSRIPEHPIGAD